MFPGANAQVYYNEAGEPLGWDYPSDEPDRYDDDDWYANNYEEEIVPLRQCFKEGTHGLNATAEGGMYDEWFLHDWVGYTMICDRCEHDVNEEPKL